MACLAKHGTAACVLCLRGSSCISISIVDVDE